MRYITSDLHFFHKNIFKFCPDTRPWLSLEEMHEYLIYHINTLPNCEMLYSLGDFSFAGKDKTAAILDRIEVPMTFILGNHCQKLGKSFYGDYGEACNYKEISHNGRKVVLFHYPMHEWNNAARGSVMLYGHVHGSFQAPGKTIDVGWDAHGRILELGEAVDLAASRPFFQPSGNHQPRRDSI